MSSVIIKNPIGQFYVEGKGFVSCSQDQATRVSREDADCVLKCAAKFGQNGAIVGDKSFAVCYIRKSDVRENGEIMQNVDNPSRRRFATFDEARTHGSRFHVRKAGPRQAPGSAGHLGFRIIETNDPVNAMVNPRTGLTNPTPDQPQTLAQRVARGVTNADLKRRRG